MYIVLHFDILRFKVNQPIIIW